MPTGCAQDSQIRSVGSGNVLHNANHLTVFEVDAIVSFKASFGLPVEKVGQGLASFPGLPRKRRPGTHSLASQTDRGRWSGDYCQHSVDSAGMLVQPIRLQHFPIIALMRNLTPGALREL